MGRKTDALFRRNSNARKIESLVKLAILRVNVVKNQHRGRCSVARSDVVQLLNLGHQDQALLRVEQVIKEQNMLDALDMMEKYINLMIKGLFLLKDNSECPEELNEATSSLIFAASRCGELPELQELRVIFGSIYGKEYTNCAIELGDNCKVNPKMTKSLSTRRPSLETREHFLKQIASDNGVVICLKENANAYNVESTNYANNKVKQVQSHEAADLKDPDIRVETHFSTTEVYLSSESIKIHDKEHS